MESQQDGRWCYHLLGNWTCGSPPCCAVTHHHPYIACAVSSDRSRDFLHRIELHWESSIFEKFHLESRKSFVRLSWKDGDEWTKSRHQVPRERYHKLGNFHGLASHGCQESRPYILATDQLQRLNTAWNMISRTALRQCCILPCRR